MTTDDGKSQLTPGKTRFYQGEGKDAQPPLSECTRGQQSTVCQNRPLNWQRLAEIRSRSSLGQGLKGGKSMLRKWTTRNKEIPILILAPDAKKPERRGCHSKVA
ncbi:hypothetical protein LOY44_13505 [Pseudomonas sp. B21-044]|uniref:hypothetical protein n=1 Tax=Pseudomonas sp. B21-044 TaxID=2895488 RepID=UPI00215E726F|nr:hypothetical protein [Pseudomonas sp. B21-044]UVL17052.1 hypothetical protein LOY44_13505 [Pseudomonas sp. B21-044]